MRLIKTFAFSVLAALAAAAALGAPSAPAETTALCKVAQTPCSPANQLTSIHLQLVSSLVIKTSLLTVLCLNALAKASVLASGSPQVIHGTEFIFTNCGTTESHNNCTISTLELPLFNLLKTAINLGVLKASNGSVQIKCAPFVECKYSSEGLALHVGGRNGANGHGMVEGKGLPLKSTGGGFCPKTAEIVSLLLEPLEDTYLDAVVASTSLSTSLSGGGKSGETITVPEGTAIKDQATLSGTNASKATGTVTYSVYADKECKELVTKAGEVSVSGGSVPASSEVKLTAGAVYYWQAVYSGDEFNGSSASPCGKEVATVKATTSLKTSLSGGGKEGEEITVAEGSKVKDQATISGTKSSTATGTIKYAVYKDKECKELATKAGEGEVKEGKAAASEEKELEAATLYYWQAEYSGDSLHEPSSSTCGKEVLTVKATTSLKTSLAGEIGPGEKPVEGEEITVAEDAVVGDTATLSGTNSSKATGTVTYRVYSDSKCKELLASAGEVVVVGGSASLSSEMKFKTGTYYWQAVYSGDALHEPSTSPCGKEIVTVIAATSLKTTLSGGGKEGEVIAVAEGSTVSDSATLSGTNASKATGTVKYFIYSDPECEELVAKAGEVSVSGGKVPPSEGKKLEPDVYYWQAAYSGDSLNYGSVSECGKEVLAMIAPITTRLSGGGQSGEEIEVLDETAVSDSATLNGANASKATGTVEYFVYSDSKCEKLFTEAGEVSVGGEEVSASEEIKLKTGIYYWQAVYSGDKENPAATSVCGAEVAHVVTSTSLTTSLSGGAKEGEEIEVEEGTPVSDKATLSGTNSATADGFAVYSAYFDKECTELAAPAGSVEVEGKSVPASEKVTLPVGTYYWQVEYSGDNLNQGSTSTCGKEILVVTAPITTTLTGGEESGEKIEVSEETAVSDEATLYGANASEAKGTAKYFVYSDPECKELATKAGEVSVSGAKVPASEKVKLKEGIYYWQVVYSGDEKNPPATSACGVEQVTVANPPRKYAAIGDSYSSGEGIGTYYWSTRRFIPWLHWNLCHRSAEAWPALAANAFYGAGAIAENEVFKQQPGSFIFRACAGAVIQNLWSLPFNPAGGQWDEFILGPPEQLLTTPAQDLWLELPGGVFPGASNNSIKLVSMTIGGNDAGFGSIAMNCIDKLPGYTLANCLNKIAEFEAGAFPWIQAKLPIVLEDVRVSAPMARIRVPLYPRVLDLRPRRNIPLLTGPLGREILRINNVERLPGGFTAAEAIEWFIIHLNQTIKATVETWAAGAPVRVDGAVVPLTENTFADHQLGNAKPWVNGLKGPWVVESFHPNKCGHIALAVLFMRNVREGVPPALCPP